MWMLVNSSEQDGHARRSTAPYCKSFTKPRSIEGSRIMRKMPGTIKIGPVPDVFVSGLLCIDTESSSSVHKTSWIRKSRGVSRWARQSSDFSPDAEGTELVKINGGAVVAHAQPEDPDLCIGRPVACHPEITPPPPHPGPPDSARPGIGRRVAFPSPSVLQKDTSTPREIPVGE